MLVKCLVQNLSLLGAWQNLFVCLFLFSFIRIIATVLSLAPHCQCLLSPSLLLTLDRSFLLNKPLSAVLTPPGEEASKLPHAWNSGACGLPSLCPADILPEMPPERGVQDPCAPDLALSRLTFIKRSLPFSFNLSVRGLFSALGKIIHLKA